MTTPERPRKPWWVLLLVAVAVGVFVYAALPPRVPELSALPGVWVREDGGYALELKSVAPDGRVEAAYRNPERSIRVARAAAVRDDESLRLIVEFSDKDYEGSRYTLAYDARHDRLAGTYFQATQGQTFAVSFARRN